MTTIGQRLHAARYAKGYKLRKVASLTGVSPSTISRAERDIPPLLGSDALIKLAACYGVSVGSLLNEDTTPKAANAYAAQLRRALLMCNIEDLANGLDGGSDEDREIAFLLRGVWIAIHKGSTGQLRAIMAPLVDDLATKKRN